MSLHQADYGTALDYAAKTVIADGTTVYAEDAVTAGPASESMFEFARKVRDQAEALGGTFCDVVTDPGEDRPGGIRVRWGSGPSPKELAEIVGPIPAWLTLHHDTDMDVRYMVSPNRKIRSAKAAAKADAKQAQR